MKITLESTDKIVTLNGLPARMWEGQSAAGVQCHAYITRLAVAKGHDAGQFDQELQQHRPPSADVAAIPSKLMIDGGHDDAESSKPILRVTTNEDGDGALHFLNRGNHLTGRDVIKHLGAAAATIFHVKRLLAEQFDVKPSQIERIFQDAMSHALRKGTQNSSMTIKY